MIKRSYIGRIDFFFLFLKVLWGIFGVYGIFGISSLGDANSLTYNLYYDNVPISVRLILIPIEFAHRYVSGDIVHLGSTFLVAVLIIILVNQTVEQDKKIYAYLVFLTPIINSFMLGYNKELWLVALNVFICYNPKGKIKRIFRNVCVCYILYVTYIIKSQVTLCLFLFLIYEIAIKVKLFKYAKTALTFLIVFTGFVVYLNFYQLFDQIWFDGSLHFNLNDNHTRTIINFDTPFAILNYMPIGLYMLAFGPTPGEILAAPILIVVFLESVILIYCLFQLIFKNPKSKYRIEIAQFYYIFVPCLLTYPFAILNIISSIRYRFPIILFVFLYLNRRKTICNSEKPKQNLIYNTLSN